MRGNVTVLAATLLVGLAAGAGAQATGMPSFNAPYRAFQRSEFGGVLSFPDGGGTGFEGVYRYASGKLDIGLRGGFFDPGGAAKTVLLVGAEARERVITHTLDFPLDGAIVFGFEIEPFRKQCLLNGLDEIGLTLSHADEIRAFEAKHKAEKPWLF